jgi:16S rRNA (guanine(966)-N(2))-methyltransferase RsmD
MRIVSGKHKGRKLNVPKKLPVRPTTDRAKEALFNILSNRIELTETSVLDLFSGTGNMSYEFGSRGVNSITAVDQSRACINFIKSKAQELDLNITAIKSDVFKYLNRNKTQYPLIFVDPPYALSKRDFEKVHELVFEKNILSEKGLLIIEHSEFLQLDHLSYFEETRDYGHSHFSFFNKPD